MRSYYFISFFLLSSLLFFTYNYIILSYSLTNEVCTIKKYNENSCELVFSSKKCISQLYDKPLCDKYDNESVDCFVSRQKYFGFCKIYFSEDQAFNEANKLIYLF